MGHHVHAAPAKFKLDFPPFWDVKNKIAELAGEETEIEVLPDEWGGKRIPKGLCTLQRLVQCHDYGYHPADREFLGWAVVQADIHEEHGKKYESIIANKLVKGKHVVWYVNESEACHVGHSSPSFIAFDRASAAALKKDIGSGRIDRDTTVLSWW